MELLKGIDWSYRRPDNNTFISDDAIKSSVTCKIIEGVFKNPILIECDSSEEMPICKDKFPRTKKTTMGKNEKDDIPETSQDYIPGRKLIPLFPEISRLTEEEHRICLKVLQCMHNYNVWKPKLTLKKNDLETYNNLIPLMKEEQEKFLNHVKNAWLTKKCVRYIKTNSYFDKLLSFRKVNIYKKYPKYYTMATMLPLVYDDIPIELQFIKKLDDSVNMETLPKVHLPSMKKKFILSMQYNINILKSENSLINEKSDLVSEDIKCETYAVNNRANIVISSSGLKTLACNQHPFAENWSLPILVKNYNITDDKGINKIHTVAYIDKALQLPVQTFHQNRQWCYKYLSKTTFLKYLHMTDCKLERMSNNSTVDCDCNENGIECDDCVPEMEHSNSEDSVTSESEDEKLIINDPLEDVSSDSGHKIVTRAMKRKSLSPKKNEATLSMKDATKNCACKQNETNPQISNVPKVKKTTYNLWKLGQSKEKSKFAKETMNDITLVVRCNEDGWIIDQTKNKQLVMIEPKMEYQYEFGAEVTHPTEVAKQWAKLKFRPGNDLLKIRIVPSKGEIVMMEKIPLHVIQNELCNRSCKPEHILGCYFGLFSRISKIPPGQYILRHETNHRAFVALYSVANETDNVGLNLEDNYIDVNESSVNQTAPWSPIDPLTVTPNHIEYAIMPCMFNYGNCKILETAEKRARSSKLQRKRWKKKTKKILKKKSL